MALRFTDLLAAASLAAVALAAPASAQTANPAANDETSTEPVKDWGAFGVQTQYQDKAVKPGDDFNLYVNGKWLAQTEIPADRARFGSFDALNNLSIARLRAILDGLSATPQAPGSAEERLANAYKAFTDTAAIDAKGMAPLQPYLAKIKAANTPTQLMSLFGQPGFASPIDVSMDPDEKQSDIYALYLSQGALGLPDRDYYLKDDAKSQEIRAKYLEYLTFVFGKLGHADAPGTARSVLELETRLAAAKWDRAAQRNPELTYNKLTRQ